MPQSNIQLTPAELDAIADAVATTPIRGMPTASITLPQRISGWEAFTHSHPDHPAFSFSRNQVVAHLITMNDRVTIYIKLNRELTRRAETLIGAGVRFPGIGYDRVLRAFVSEVQHPGTQVETVFLWCKFLGNICAGRAGTLPPGVQYRLAETHAQRFNL